MKKLIFFSALMSLIISCSDDDDYNDYVSLVTVVNDSDGQKVFMRNDSTRMYPINFDILSDPGQRMLVEYYINDTYDSNDPYKYGVVVEDYDIVLTKYVVPLTAENEEEVGDDAFWNIFDVTYSGGFINVYLSFLYNYNPHLINLVENTVTPPVNAPDSINFELRQNANGDNTGYPVSELVSFNVQNYIAEANAEGLETITFAIKVMLPNDQSSIFKVVVNLDNYTGDDKTYNSLEVYEPVPNALE